MILTIQMTDTGDYHVIIKDQDGSLIGYSVEKGDVSLDQLFKNLKRQTSKGFQ